MSFFGMLLSGSKGFAHAPGMVFKIIVVWGFHPNDFFGEDENLSIINQQ
ncbi:MAG: hypothetical protein ACI4CY_05125 [Candidatus Gastranaerophilaceae bacterium]